MLFLEFEFSMHERAKCLKRELEKGGGGGGKEEEEGRRML